MIRKSRWILSIILTILAQYAAILENGKLGAGGNIFVPLLCYLIFWECPKVFKFLRKEKE